MTVTLPCTYIGSTALYKAMVGASCVYTEVFDHYSRQTCRNRATILGANGLETLIVPVVKPKEKTLVKDILINNDKPWQIEHLRAIQTAYNSSPFLEFYLDDLLPFYTRPQKYLAEFNMDLQQTICSLIGIDTPQEFTHDYHRDVENDLRPLVDKHADVPNELTVGPYYQVFKEKFGFTPNVSIIDLLMNMGPESRLLLH